MIGKNIFCRDETTLACVLNGYFGGVGVVRQQLYKKVAALGGFDGVPGLEGGLH